MSLVKIDLVILDVNRRPMKGFPIETKYVGGKKKLRSFSDKDGNLSITVSPHRDFEVYILTTNDTFELNATINSDKAGLVRQKIVLPKPITSYTAQTEMSVIDLDKKPVANAKYKYAYKGSTIPDKKVGADGKILLKTTIGEPSTITMLRPDNSEIPNPYIHTASRMKMHLIMKLSMHQHETNTAPNQPTSTPAPITPPQQGHISLADAHKIACKITGYNEGAHGNDPNAQYKILADNFDGQGMSWGILQWNFGQGTLTTLLKKMRTKNPAAFNAAFTNQNTRIALENALDTLHHPKQAQIHWAIEMETHPRRPEWRSIFNNFGDVPDFQELQLEETLSYQQVVFNDIKWMKNLLPDLVVGVPLYMYCALFDLSTQQGGIASYATVNGQRVEQNKHELAVRWAAHHPTSLKRALIDAVTGRSSHANHTYSADTLSRRLTIINGQTTSASMYGHSANRENPHAHLATNDLVDGIPL